MSVTTDIASLASKKEPYTARASLKDGLIDSSTSSVTGDRSTGLFDPKAKEMGKDDFLLLLVTQLRFQDPLNPMENTEFVSQLAQFRSMESSSNIETAIKNLDTSFKGTVDAQTYAAKSMTNTSAVSLIGKEVKLRQTNVQWVAKAGEKADIQIHLGDAAEAVIEIKDNDGTVIKTLKSSGKDKNNTTVVRWDGSTDAGKIAKTGSYKIHIMNEESNSALFAYVQDVASGIRFTKDGALVKVAGKEISIGNILDVATGAGGTSDSQLLSSSTVSLLGKYVRVKQDSVTYQQKNNENITVNIQAGGNQNVQVDILDRAGSLVNKVYCTTDENGIGKLSWNGSKLDGGYAAPGSYTVKIKGQENNPYIYSFIEGPVDGISGIGGLSSLRVNGQIVTIKNIIDIGNTSVNKDGVRI